MDHPLFEAARVLDWYTDFFGIPYPLPRLQLVGIPEFPLGGMENYGLITFRDDCFLAKPGVTSRRGLQIATETVLHEVAHQWCGNCVSPLFWESVWLNEGFATLVPYLALEEYHSDLSAWELFFTSLYLMAIELDVGPGSHPIHSVVNSDDEIESNFDAIIYGKAASVIRMSSSKATGLFIRNGFLPMEFRMIKFGPFRSRF
jgi:puromycin-sensitive aminopeptidase